MFQDALFDMAGFAYDMVYSRENIGNAQSVHPVLDPQQHLGSTRVPTVQERVGMHRSVPCLELQPLHAFFPVTCQ